MTESIQDPPKKITLLTYLKFVFFSLFGMFLFFVPITISMKGVAYNSIPIDIIVTFIKVYAPWLGPLAGLIFVLVGGITAWTGKNRKKDTLTTIINIFRTLGIPFAVMAYFNFGPAWLMTPDMLPAVFKNITVSVALVVPIGALCLSFILDYGILEFIGYLVRPIMRPVFRVPGKAAVNAVASFIGSFSVGIMITNKLYADSKYTYREAAIIMTSFSTVSAAFMVIVAKTAGLMPIWNFYFWTALVITFLVSAICVRLWPYSKMPDTYIDGVGKPEIVQQGVNPFKQAWKEGLETAANTKPLLQNLWVNIKGGMNMILVLAPTGASIATIAFILVKMTPVFDILGYVFFPITYLLSLLGLPDPITIAKLGAVALGEMFVPNTLAVGTAAAVRYVIAVVSISEIIFFGGYLPCLYSVDLKISLPKVLVLWFERTALSILFAGGLAIIFQNLLVGL